MFACIFSTSEVHNFLYMSASPSREDIAALRRDKYNDDPAADLTQDLERLAQGEPLAYVIGWQPFLGLSIDLSSKPLIPRPETEWWTEKLIEHLTERFGTTPFSVLDLCAGSGAIGLSILKHCPYARVSFGEIVPEHVKQIAENLERNQLDATRADIRVSDVYAGFSEQRFNLIATNPPYIPEGRELSHSVSAFEPHEALYSGEDGLLLIRRIAAETPLYVASGGELWMECDESNAQQAAELLATHGATSTQIYTDQYDRERLVVGYYP